VRGGPARSAGLGLPLAVAVGERAAAEGTAGVLGPARGAAVLAPPGLLGGLGETIGETLKIV